MKILSKKHFLILACAIRGIEEEDIRAELREKIGDFCVSRSKKFDWDKWRVYINGL